MFMTIYSIFVRIVSWSCLRICWRIVLRDTWRFLRYTAFFRWYQATCRIIHWVFPEQFHTSSQFKSTVQFLACLPIHASQFSWQEFAEYWMQEGSLDKKHEQRKAMPVMSNTSSMHKMVKLISLMQLKKKSSHLKQSRYHYSWHWQLLMTKILETHWWLCLILLQLSGFVITQ